MFQKKQIIYSESLGACVVDNIVSLAVTKGGKTIPYYVLKPLFEEKVSYIPVENHQVVLREMFTVVEAKELLEQPDTKKNERLLAALKYVLKESKQED